MPRTVTLATIRTMIQDEADVRDPPFSDAMLNRWINIAKAKFYDLITQADPDRFWKETTISVVSGTGDYSLPSDHLFTHIVAVLKTNGNYQLMERFQIDETYDYQDSDSERTFTRYRVVGSNIRFIPTPGWSGTVKHCYIPVLSDLSSDTDTIDCVNGWEEYIVADVCAKCRSREEGDNREFVARRREIEQHIKSLGSRRNVSKPDKVGNRKHFFERRREPFRYGRP